MEEIFDRVNPYRDKFVIFFGLGMKINDINVEELPLWNSKNCVFIVSSNVRIERENVFSIPLGETESQNYIAASDFVISKPGWGTVSEAIVYNVPLLVLNRTGMKEDKNTIQFILEHGLGEVIEWGDLLEYQVDTKMYGKKINAFKNEVEDIVDSLLSLG